VTRGSALCSGILALLVLAPPGCGSATRAQRLVDGTAPTPLPAVLGRLGHGAIRGRVRVLTLGRLDRLGQACARSFRTEYRLPPSIVAVQRTGRLGESLTFRDAAGATVLGCDAGAAPRHWCSRSVGRLFGGRLRDPRVDVSCRDARGRPVSFAWVQPHRRTRWLVTGDDGRQEVLETAAGLPVRITAADADVRTASATFSVVEFDAHGEVVDRYALRAAVAG